jgi:hypothetical protein
MSTQPTADEQVRFLLKIQRLLNEGGFTSTYKYALLLALADIAVETREGGDGLAVRIDRIAEKYIEYYARQVKPYHAIGAGAVELMQNTGRQAAIATAVSARGSHLTIPEMQRDRLRWDTLVREVASNVLKYPLWLLQRVGTGSMISFTLIWEGELRISPCGQVYPFALGAFTYC